MSDYRLDQALRMLNSQGTVSSKIRYAVESTLSPIPPAEEIIDAFPCSILSGTSGRDGVAVLTAGHFSAYERRGFTPDQKLHVVLARPFTIEPGPGATRVTLASAGGRPTTLELFTAERAKSLRDELAALSSAREEVEEGWWSQASIPWPGWLGSAPTWSYLGGDPRLPSPGLNLRLNVGPTGFKLGDADGSTAPVAPWSVVSQLQVLNPEQGLERAATRGVLSSDGFGAAWRSAEWSAFIVLTYGTGEQVFLGTTELTGAELCKSLFRVAEAMPADRRPSPAAEPPAATPEPPAATPEPPAVEQPPAPYRLAEQLAHLGELHRQGVIDDTEFARAKAAVLGG